MDELEFVERLARAARGTAPPSVDVADRVMRRLGREVAPEVDGGFSPFAVGVSAATVALLFLAVQSFMAGRDPFVEILNMARVVFP